MADMLVKLYALPVAPPRERLAARGVEIRRAMALDKRTVLEWVREKFNEAWASECEVTFSHQPVSCLLAVKDHEIVGFACYEATCRGFFGPTGVYEAWRGQGIGAALLFESLEAMKAMGYAYAVIGGAGPEDFYRKTVGAVSIEGSVPGFYKDALGH